MLFLIALHWKVEFHHYDIERFVYEHEDTRLMMMT